MTDESLEEKTQLETRFWGKPATPPIPDHTLLRCIGGGSYGDVWLARNIMGTYRAVKIVYRKTFSSERPYEREFTGIQKFEPISRSHESQVDILQVGRADGYFYYVMELADCGEGEKEQGGKRRRGEPAQCPSSNSFSPLPLCSSAPCLPCQLRAAHAQERTPETGSAAVR